jgi:hypothetical protein
VGLIMLNHVVQYRPRLDGMQWEVMRMLRFQICTYAHDAWC